MAAKGRPELIPRPSANSRFFTNLNTQKMKIVKILTGHISRETAYVSVDVKRRYQKVAKYQWIETKPRFGDRLVTVVHNPISLKESKPTVGKFTVFAFLFEDETGNVRSGACPFNKSSRTNQKAFGYLMARLDPTKLSYEQQYHIRKKIYEVFLSNAISEQKNLTGWHLGRDKDWTRATLDHIEKSPFARIADYPPFIPQQDHPITDPLRWGDPAASGNFHDDDTSQNKVVNGEHLP